jgi:hypothetical protein
MMTKKEQAHLMQTIEDLLRDWNLDAHVTAEEIARHVLGGSAYWFTDLPDGATLALVRLYSPVVQRREVFLGNVLLNDFLFKALPRAVERVGLGDAAPLPNDLENACILWHGDGDLDALREAYREEVIFHYGHHADWELKAIQQQIDYVLAEVGGEKETDELWDDLQRLRGEVAHQHGAAVAPIDLMDWMASMSSALEVIHQMQQDVVNFRP